MSCLSISYLIVKYYPKASFNDPEKGPHKHKTLSPTKNRLARDCLLIEFK